MLISINSQPLPRPSGKYTYLTSREIKYLRLYVHGWSDETISKFLDITIKRMPGIKTKIEKKFRTIHWLSIISMALQKNYLHLPDFVEQSVTHDALSLTETLLTHYIKPKTISPYTDSDLKDTLKLFIKAHKERSTKIYKNQSLNTQLNQKELWILKQCYKTHDIEYYMNDTNKPTSIEKHKIKLDIFLKLNVSNWFAAFRKANLLGLFDDIKLKGNKCSFCDKQITHLTNKLMAMRKLKDIELYEKKKIIYDELIKIHLHIEFHSLLYV
ncbi:MAG: hypothetical protein AAF901_11345 [Bacteroidota bacterium]